MIFIDILGFSELPRELSIYTHINENYIRENFLIKPLIEKINSILNNNDKHFTFTDDHFIITNDLIKIFKLVNGTTNLSIPLTQVKKLPLEIAVGSADLEDDYDLISQNSTITFLKNDILKSYRSYYKLKNNDKIKESFVVITREFYNELPNDRGYLCSLINHNGKVFYLADLAMMADIDTKFTKDLIQVKKFEDKISKLSIWEYFEIKVLCFRIDHIWKAQFLYIKLLENQVSEIPKLQTDHMIMFHKVYNITYLNEF